MHAVKQRKANLFVHRLRWNCFIRQVIEGKMEEKKRRGRRRKQILEALRKRAFPGKWKRKLLIVLSGELVVEEAMNLSQDRLRNKMNE